MKLYLDFLRGPLKGQTISLKKTTSVGRVGADLVIEDPKLSGIHVFFKLDPEKGWSIHDEGSRNGVWINGHKEVKARLETDDYLQFGGNQVRCRVLEQPGQKLSLGLQVWAAKLIKKIKNQKSTVAEINPEMRLSVVQGIQYGEYWDVFYGPRQAGRESIDICLYDDKAPKDSFQIQVKGQYAYFFTEHPRIVKINDQSVASKQFAPGDVISLGQSKILVEFDEGHGFGS